LKIKAFSVCRYYTVTAQLCQPSLGQWGQPKRNPALAGAQ